MHVLLIHQAFATAQDAGGTRHVELGHGLLKRGHRFTAVASTVSYMTAETVSTPRTAVERLGGMTVLRVPSQVNIHRSFLHRGLSFVQFSVASLRHALRVPAVDVVYGTSPPLFQAVSALLVARLRRKPFVFEVRDLWPEFAVALGIVTNPLVIAPLRILERLLYRAADRLIVNSPGFIPYLVARGVERTKIGVVPNGVDTKMFEPAAEGARFRREFGFGDCFLALYAGAHGIANNLTLVLEAAELLRGQEDLLFVLVGDGKEKQNLEQRAHARRLANVRFLPAQPKSRMPEVLAAADVCLAVLQDTPLLATGHPNKIFDYMAAGRPVVLSIGGVPRQLVEAAEGGTPVAPGDARALADAVLRYRADISLRRRHGNNARAYVAENFDREKQVALLEAELLLARRQ